MTHNNELDFTVCSYNCNGLNNFKKRKDVFEYLHQQNCNIYFLQETHWKTQTENFIRTNWGYNAYVCGKESNKNGVAILFNNNFECKVLNVVRDIDGCFIIMNVEMLKKKITLVNVYGPSAGDHPEYFDKLFDHVERLGNDSVLLAGDWNCALNTKIDVRNYLSITNRPKTRRKIHDIMNNYSLFDIFREMYPDKRLYTWRKFNTIKQARLDYFLATEDILINVKDVVVKSSYRSDHSPVILHIKKEQFKRDRPFWKFNNSLLKDLDYVNEIKKTIIEVKKQYAVLAYNFENIEMISNEELTLQIGDQLFFETLLLAIRGKTISFATFKKKETLLEEKNLEKQIHDIESNVQGGDVQELERLKIKLQDIRNVRIDGIAVRSKIRWINEGEKVSKYFCNMENRNFIDKSMFVLERENGEVITDQKDILNEVQAFYKELYSFRDVINVEMELHDVPILSDEEQQILEGLITYREAAASLKKMKNNKSPGPDGFTVEFYKFFFVDLGHFLVRSINEGFKNQEMSITQKQGMIVCIPKDSKPKRFVKNWRPISLLNTTYKIASACIADRLKCILPNIIDECQKGFLKGRYIGEHIRLLYDTMAFVNKEQIPGMIFSIDMEKAFDSVSWSFLERCLNFFNFGPDMIRWIKSFYCNITSCILINGQYSDWFPIERGVRQGDPLSPYLYLICAEILSLMIRKNKAIKGIQIKNRENLLSQFADDTTLCLDGTEKSFAEAVAVLVKFGQISGLHINFDKSQVIWIGSRRNCNLKYMRDKNFVWDPGTFKILGFIFSTNLDDIVKINFDNKLLEIKKILSYWSKRHITPFGKITVIKSLVFSKIIHLLINLPDPSDEFINSLEKELYAFLWNEKNSKIKKSVVCKDYADGGLKMLDIRSFVSSMKISWLRRLCYDSSWKQTTVMLYPDLCNIHIFGGEYANVAMKNICNLFWRDVLRHYKKFCVKCRPTDESEFMSEFIFYNIHFLRDRKIIFINEWLNNNIYMVNHLVDETGEFMNFDKFKAKHTGVRTNFLTYNGVIYALKEFQKKYNIELTNNYKAMDNKTWFNIKKGNKQVQSVLVSSDTIPTAIPKWNSLYQNLKWNTIYSHVFKTTGDVQLRWFQCRLLHRLLPTQRYLFYCKIVDSPICNFCEKDEQTIEHMLYDCTFVTRFWNELQQILQNKCQHCSTLILGKQLTLFGWKDDVGMDPVSDFIILFAKFYIYKCKLENNTPQIDNFLLVLKHRYILEKYIAAINGKTIHFEQNWKLYLSILP